MLSGVLSSASKLLWGKPPADDTSPTSVLDVDAHDDVRFQSLFRHSVAFGSSFRAMSFDLSCVAFCYSRVTIPIARPQQRTGCTSETGAACLRRKF